MKSYYLGVDVGSGSVRCGLFDTTGTCLLRHAEPIQQFRPRESFVEQSSEDIWQACGKSVRAVVQQAGARAAHIKAIGFDATCSLVALDIKGQPTSVSPDNDPQHNIVMWMDHRATQEALDIAATGHSVLDYIGGKVSPELELPKLLWLARHHPEQYARTAMYLDLADFMVARAVGSLENPSVCADKSVCTQVCKWFYLAHEGRWPNDLLATLGIDSLLEKPRMQGDILAPGRKAGMLDQKALDDFGLSGDIVVAMGMIDAHAGALGMLGDDPEGGLVIIGGTSSCHIALAPDALFVPGVWGPYWGAVLPDSWIAEGGQSATGALIEHVITSHPAHAQLVAEAEKQGLSHFDILNHHLITLENNANDARLTRHVHLLDYHHGNRSPLADPSLTGMLTGLTLAHDLDDLAIKYLATLQAISYGTRHIVETLNRHGYAITNLRVCGGMLHNPRWLQETADATGLKVSLPTETDSVLLGSAMLAATACGEQANLREAARHMGSIAQSINPNPHTRAFHDAKYRVYRAMHGHQIEYKTMMQQS